MPAPVSLTVKCKTTSGPPATRGRPPAHFAAIGEFDRIAHQIDRRSAAAVIVAHDAARHVRMAAERQFQVLLVGADGQRFHGVAEAFAQIEGDVFQDHLARLDLGENRGCR
jgi:hypothetical protein